MIRRVEVKNIPLIILSFIIAVFIWASAMEVKNPVIDSYEIKGIKVEILNTEKGPAQNDLSVIDGKNQTINLTVTGRRNDITAIDTSNIVASVDVSLISKSGDYTLPVDIELNNTGISIVEKKPSSISIYIDEIQSKTLPVDVHISGSVSESAVMGQYSVDPASVTITGPKSELANVVSAVAYVEVPKDETNNFGVRSSIVLIDADGQEVTSSHITQDSQYVDVYVPVLGTMSMQAQVTTTGEPDLHYELISVSISPSDISVAGDEDALAAAGTLLTETVDISGLTETTVINRTITLPDGIKNTSGTDEYTIIVEIAPRTFKDFTLSRYEFENVNEGNTIQSEPVNLTVRIWGTEENLALINEASIVGIIDMQDEYYAPGTYQMPIAIKIADSSLSGGVAVEGEYTLTIEAEDK